MDEPLPFRPIQASIDDAYELRGRAVDAVESWDPHVIVDVIHDGTRIPPTLGAFFDADGDVLPEVQDAFVRERDWGAAAVADRLSHHLGLRGYYCNQAARVVCDYNRFRGRSVIEAGHLGRRAIFPPATHLLSHEMSEHALQACFDPVSKALFARVSEAFNQDQRVPDSRLLRITVHTYDDRAGEGQRRPKTSLIFTPYEYHLASRLPADVYPPIFPDRLAEFTADRALAYRMALMLEKNYLPVAVNSPYFLPLGGAEMRLQVWCYVQHLKQVTQMLDPDVAQRLAPLWPVIEAVDRPWGSREISTDSLTLLSELAAFIERNRYESVERYRYSAFRPSAIEVEVRKDIVYRGSWKTLSDGSDAFVPEEGGLVLDEVDRVASVMAAGIRKYLIEDQPEKRAGALLQ